MSDRGLPIIDGAPACPFVAFDDDRDGRATSPDPRHRCYAEVRPAPRALAHQEAYCLSSAFPVCPTFQDWARREAAIARGEGSGLQAEGGRDAAPAGAGPGNGSEAQPGSIQRNPRRDWAAPPPWASGPSDVEGDEDVPEVQARPPVAGGGLAGSFADRLSAGSSSRRDGAAARLHREPDRLDDIDGDGDEDDEDDEDRDEEAAPAASITGRSRSSVAHRQRGRPAERGDRRPASGLAAGPSWERPRRMDAYPTLKTRVGLPSISAPPILIGLAALVIAAVALFILPTLLGIGNPPDSGARSTATAAATAVASGTPAPPTPTPGPTQQVYLVQAGDTMSRIANRFGVPLQTLIDANRETIPNPDVLQIGQEVLIPSVAPTSLPDAGVSPSP